ncbi:MAG TPA: hypothetical protein DF613_02005 [Lachnospiraceae bacterium]|nr:hypothetical protein [Lachnospiraceae bacterium]
MKRKWLGIVLSFTMAASLMTGCSNSDSTAGSNSAASQAGNNSSGSAASQADSGSADAPESAVSSGAEASAPADADFDPSSLKVCICIGEVENEAGIKIQQAYEDMVEKYGFTDVTMVDAKYDAVVQSEQIESCIQTKPDVIFIHPADPTGISEAVSHVIDAGIPVFCNEGSVTGLEDKLTSQCRTDNYSQGYATMTYLAEAMGGKGKVGMCYLDSNANWHERDLGALAALENYPDIEVVQEWFWDSTGVFTPRMAVDDMITACPNVGDLDAVWSAWDGGALEGIQAAKAAGRTELLFAGTDGGPEACQQILDGDQFLCSGGPMLYNQVVTLVDNAMLYLQGEDIPQCVWSPNVLLTKEGRENASSLLEDGEALENWDLPGYAEKWGLTISPTIEH